MKRAKKRGSQTASPKLTLRRSETREYHYDPRYRLYVGNHAWRAPASSATHVTDRGPEITLLAFQRRLIRLTLAWNHVAATKDLV